MTNERREYREFWIEQDDNEFLEVRRHEPKDKIYQTFHVIEYSAFSECQDELQYYKREFESCAEARIGFTENLKMLYDENAKLTAELSLAKKELDVCWSIADIVLSFTDSDLDNNEKHEGLCAFCDSGGSGWSTKGEGYHDDKEPNVCGLIQFKKLQHDRKDRGE